MSEKPKNAWSDGNNPSNNSRRKNRILKTRLNDRKLKKLKTPAQLKRKNQDVPVRSYQKSSKVHRVRTTDKHCRNGTKGKKKRKKLSKLPSMRTWRNEGKRYEKNRRFENGHEKDEIANE